MAFNRNTCQSGPCPATIMLTTFVSENKENLLTWFRIFISWLFCNQEEIGCGRKVYYYLSFPHRKSPIRLFDPSWLTCNPWSLVLKEMRAHRDNQFCKSIVESSWFLKKVDVGFQDSPNLSKIEKVAEMCEFDGKELLFVERTRAISTRVLVL